MIDELLRLLCTVCKICSRPTPSTISPLHSHLVNANTDVVLVYREISFRPFLKILTYHYPENRLLSIRRRSSMKITSGSHSRWRWTYRKRCQTMASRVLKPASLAPVGHISAAKDFASSFWLILVRGNGGIFNFSFFFFKTFFFLQRNEIIGRCFTLPLDRANSCTFVGKFENANMPRI